MSKKIWQGASVLLLDDGAPVFALKIKANTAYLTGIGGKVETDETYRQCAMRETLEETGTELRIIDAASSLHVDFAGKISKIKAENGAIAQVHKAANSPQGKPWDYSITEQQLRVDIFLGKLSSAPKAIEKHPAFIAISAEILPDVIQYGLDIARVHKTQSIRIIGGKLPEKMPPRAYITDSLEALFIALGDDLEKFLADAAMLSE